VTTNANAREDFPNWGRRAVPISVISNAGSSIEWGNGWAQYPNFEDVADLDYVLFRGVEGSNYEVSAQPVGPSSSADLEIRVERWNLGGAATPIASGKEPAGASAIIQTGPLPADDWYAVGFNTRLFGTSGAWRGTIRVVDGSDDLSDLVTEAYPMPHDVWMQAHLDENDYDSKPSGGVWGWGYGSVTNPSATSGHWTWVVVDNYGIERPYSTRAQLGCATGSPPCDDLSESPPIAARFSWGDRFAGRLTNADASATYEITLAQYQEASFSLPDGDPYCQLELELRGPDEMEYFHGEPIWKWRDGAAANTAQGYHGLGAGGHVIALRAGTYSVTVRPSQYQSGCYYRLFMATSDFSGHPMPTW
jgi:hypothetical protein